MELSENDKIVIGAINSNDVTIIIEKLFDKKSLFCRFFNINILNKNNVHLFNENAIFLTYFRGLFYYHCGLYKKTILLMKLFRRYLSFRNMQLLNMI